MNLSGGTTLGGYRLETQIGHGAMATVYRASQSALNRPVAVKVLPLHMATDGQFLARFRREATLVAGLQHPNILPVHDFGEQDGILYIVMMLVEGGTLEDRLGSPLPIKTVLSLGSQLADALDYAHQRGVIHRDVKPSNVLMGGPEWALLTDFGIARILDEDTQLTQSGMAIGTPSYMSPEQAQGLELDGRSDLYSLGIMLHEMLTGQVPYKSSTMLGTLQMHMTAPVPSVRSLRQDVPPALDEVIARTLAKWPAGRYQRGSDLKAALEGIRRGLEQTEVSAQAVPGPPAGPDVTVRGHSSPSSQRPAVAGTTGNLDATVLASVSSLNGSPPAAPVEFGDRTTGEQLAPRKLPVAWPVIAAACLAALVLVVAGGLVASGVLARGRQNAVATGVSSNEESLVEGSAGATPTATASVTSSTVAPRTPVETIFETTFRGGQPHGWTGGANDTIFVQDNKLNVTSLSENRFRTASPPVSLQLENFICEATITRLSGDDRFPHGIVFRNGDKGFYVFGIHPPGTYYLSRFNAESSTYERIISSTASSAIVKDTGTNTLRVEAYGPNIRLFANGQFIAEATDSTLPRGNIGMWAGNNGVRIAVSSVKVAR